MKPTDHDAPAASRVQYALLASGVAASVVYAVADMIGGWLSPGYRFSSDRKSVV